MKKGLLIVVAIALIAGVYVYTINNKKQDISYEVKNSKEVQGAFKSNADDLKDQAEAKAQEVMQKADALAKEEKAKAEAMAKEVEARAQEALAQAQAAAKNMESKIQALIAKAKDLLANGDFEGAIQTAKQILGLDSNSSEAKGIIEQAKVKIQEAVQAKLGSTKEGLVNKIPAFGL